MEVPQYIAQHIINSKYICVMTGAGISAESGIATFRGKDGLWSKFRPEELASIDAFMANPDLVWEWYQHRRDILTNVKPNLGHRALADWEHHAPRFALITQNVDGLHAIAGNRHVFELHGSIRINRCNTCGQETTMDEISFTGRVPRCSCGGMLRPGVVWFGEMLPQDVFQAAMRSASTCDLFLSVGTSAVVYPAASLTETAILRGIPVIEVNLEETPITPQVTYSFRGLAGEILPELVRIYKSSRFNQSAAEQK